MKRILLCGMLVFSLGAGVARAEPLVQFTLDNNGFSSWFVSSSSANIGPTGSGNANPTLTLTIGTRYEVTTAHWPFHVFELISKGAMDTDDTALLSQDDPTALFNTDAGVNWTNNGAGVSDFTLTPTLAAAMFDPAQSLVPGYRCGIHTMTMRGDISLVPEPATMCLLGIGAVSALAYAWQCRKRTA